MSRFALLALVFSLGCGHKSGARGEAGHERGDCRSGDNKCETGLLCLSNLCVRPPPADCQMLADTIASMELGNYAEPEERGPIVGKYKAQCEKVYVSKEEGECIDKVKDKWSAAQCAPRMFPEMMSTKGDCKGVADRVKTVMQQSAQNQDPQMQQWFDTTVRVVQRSCEEDHWPDGLKKCIMAQQQATADAMQACNQEMPPALQQKLQDRLQTAMREQMK
jgi:hypothetical protein